MCIDVDWNTLILTTITCGVTAWAGAKYGASLAFKNNKKLEAERKREKELNSIYTYYGHLLSLYNGYDSWASSFTQLSGKFRIENNIAKIKNTSPEEWGILGFIVKNSLKLYDKIFRLERNTGITVEKTELYSEVAGSGDTSIKPYIIAKRQFVEVYAEIIAMIHSLNNYTETYYNQNLITAEMEEKLDVAQNNVGKIVEDLKNEKCKLGDEEDFLKRMEDKKDWYIQFDEGKKNA